MHIKNFQKYFNKFLLFTLYVSTIILKLTIFNVHLTILNFSYTIYMALLRKSLAFRPKNSIKVADFQSDLVFL